MSLINDSDAYKNKAPHQDRLPVLVICGPTASGKSALAMEVADSLHAEIVCMDSMQVYRRMDIGTAKPTAADRIRVRHHMLDVIEPSDSFSVSEYVNQVHALIPQIHARGHIPLLCGGTGLYLQGLSHQYGYGEIPGSPQLRAQLHAELDHLGGDALHLKLKQVDPISASRIHPHDTRRVIRALEVYLLTGKTMTEHAALQQNCESPYRFLAYGLLWEREELRRRIDDRVVDMFADGLEQEVRSLLSDGVSPDAQSMQAIGYKETADAILKGTPLRDAVQSIQFATRAYARRQMIWFRRDRRIHWLPPAPFNAETIKKEWSIFCDD